MSRLSTILISIAVVVALTLTVLNLQMVDAETNLDTIDVKIGKLQLDSIGTNNSPNLIKLLVNFENNGDSKYLVNSKNLVSLIYAQPNTSAEDLAPDTKNLMIENYDYTYYLQLETKYPNYSSSGDCKRLDFSVPAQESRQISICFEVSNQGISSLEESIQNDQYFLKIEAVPYGSSCPNCKIISLNDVSDDVDSDSEVGFVSDSYAKKFITVTQECNAGTLQLLVIDQDGKRRENAKITDIHTHPFASTDHNGTVIMPSDKQGKLFMVFSASQDPLTLMAEVCGNNARIPDWIHNNAKWWVEGTIGDGDFTSGIQYLIKEGIIKIPETVSTGNGDSQEIPGWIKNNADWWAQGLISDDDFVKGIQYLVEQGIIQV